MTKNYLIRRLLFMGALLVAVTASADSYFFIEDPVIKPSDCGTQITLPVKASFDKDVTSWDVRFTYPEGLTPVSVTAGSDLNFTYVDDRGRTQQTNFYLNQNNDLTHFVCCTYGTRANMYDDEGEFNPSGLLKWEAGTYDEMFLITFMVNYNITDSNIEVYTQTSCGYDNNPSSGITPDPSISSFVYEADVNGDGQISISDVTTMLDYIINEVFDPCSWSGEGYYYCGDINHDGYVNILDLNILCDYLWLGVWYTGYEFNEANTLSPVSSFFYDAPVPVLFYIDPVELSPEDRGHDIIVPVMARFESMTSSWDVQFEFSEGLTPVNITPGSDMTLSVYDSRGRLVSVTPWQYHNNECTHYVAVMMQEEYRLTDDDDLEFCGTVKWQPGDYNELFLLTFHVSDNFESGSIQVSGSSTCGLDIRDGAPRLWQDVITIPEDGFYPGDVNGDCVVDVSDVTYFIAYLSGMPLSYFMTESADIHPDGVIDLLDLEKLIDYIFMGTWYEGYVLSEIEEGYSFTPVDVINPPIVPSDLNGDTLIDISDITLLISWVLTGEQYDNPLADVNGDGVVDITDVILIINYVLTH